MVAERISSALLSIGHSWNKLFCSVWFLFVSESPFVGVEYWKAAGIWRVAFGWMVVLISYCCWGLLVEGIACVCRPNIFLASLGCMGFGVLFTEYCKPFSV